MRIELPREKCVAKYFDGPPTQWGLRGDPFLWNELREATAQKRIPLTVSELEKMLHKLFEDLVGEKPRKGKNVFVERFDNGGMSSGMVCGDFWLEQGFARIFQQYINEEMR
jgi:hypothetical protein